MRTRLFVPVLAGLFVVGGCAGAGTPAATVNGADIDRSQVDDLIDVLQSSDDPSLQAQFEPVPGVLPTEVASAVVTVLVQDEVLGQAVEELDLEVTDDDVAAAEAQNQSSGFDEIDALAAQVTANAIAVGEDRLPGFFADAEVQVDPRYGVWDPELARVVPPAVAADTVG